MFIRNLTGTVQIDKIDWGLTEKERPAPDLIQQNETGWYNDAPDKEAPANDIDFS
jgi:hypothetical protein